MKTFLLPLLATLGLLLLAEAPAQAQQTKKKYNRARSGAYSRYDRSGRRDEENLKLAPGMRLNMPSPPTTDYMGRPLKKKPARPSTTTTTLSAGDAPAKAAPKTTRRR
ncbi:hypothetical protein SAMN06265337_3307 [Hymenobacter gelipurpurascens]|uniref:Secreted protein n=1 Tax=Hymenobacter gelipurpurascens TaxID=89968 RepID=A0A212UDK5_9BACT|nr:hypothetical protein [Hymenobacter gelipurpurascens]SNC76283.1 hypothetical protein SAMN06265337_3307 [Hymenobacter gelipurpurascens]